MIAILYSVQFLLDPPLFLCDLRCLRPYLFVLVFQCLEQRIERRLGPLRSPVVQSQKPYTGIGRLEIPGYLIRYGKGLGLFRFDGLNFFVFNRRTINGSAGRLRQ